MAYIMELMYAINASDIDLVNIFVNLIKNNKKYSNDINPIYFALAIKTQNIELINYFMSLTDFNSKDFDIMQIYTNINYKININIPSTFNIFKICTSTKNNTLIGHIINNY